MKNDDLFSAMSEIDDAYIEEARPKQKASPRMRWIRFGALAATFAIIIGALSAWLMIPFNTDPNAAIREYQDSEYYPLIEKLNAASWRAPKYKNNLEKLLASLKSPMGGSDVDYAPESGAPNYGASDDAMGDVSTSTGRYEETTDNQVEGVVEADLIKRTSTHFYYYSEGEILVYSIAGEDSALVNRVKISVPEGTQNVYQNKSEFYLTLDGQSLLLIQSYYHKSYGACYDLVSLDISSPEAVTERPRIRTTGRYTSSRLVGDPLLMIGEYTIGNGVRYDDPETYLPLVNTGDGFIYPAMEDVLCPDTVTNRRYTVINKIDAKTLALSDTLAVLSCSDILYVSEGSIYLTNPSYKTTVMDGVSANGSATEIIRIRYDGESFEHGGSVTLDGYLKDQYSLDEYEGKLRVVTTSDRSVYKQIDGGMSWGVQMLESGTSANLFVVDLATMQVIADVLRFAPIGETVRSVRFDGNAAYVCTAVQLTDPVFFFDLSDLENITYKDTGTITGFSTSLIQLGNGYLLGIGVGNAGTVKVEVYEESERGVVSVDVFEIEDAGYSAAYKSYLIDRERGYFGFGFTDYGSVDKTAYARQYYVVLHFNGYELVELARVKLSGDESRRALCVDDCLYFFGTDAFEALPLK